MFLLSWPPQLHHTGQDVSIHDDVVRPFSQCAKDLCTLGCSAQAILQFMRSLEFFVQTEEGICVATCPPQLCMTTSPQKFEAGWRVAVLQHHDVFD